MKRKCQGNTEKFASPCDIREGKVVQVNENRSKLWEIRRQNVRRAENVGACPTLQRLNKGNERANSAMKLFL